MKHTETSPSRAEACGMRVDGTWSAWPSKLGAQDEGPTTWHVETSSPRHNMLFYE